MRSSDPESTFWQVESLVLLSTQTVYLHATKDCSNKLINLTCITKGLQMKGFW